jgi:heat shock protein HslJ
MSRVFRHFLLAAALVATLPAAALAQDGSPLPEGPVWHLTAYADDGLASVPFAVPATLQLEGGTATGSSGCNAFTGRYMIEGDRLTFDEQFALTRAACPDEIASRVEDAYLAALPQVATWAIEDEQLVLSATDDARLLVFEEPVLSLTRSALAQIAGLISDQGAELAEQQAGLDQVNERVDDIRIGTLRERIRTLESQVSRLQSQAASSSASGSGSSSAFNTAEDVLLKAIPQKVRKTCQPLRSGLPRGTAAAVACDGSRRTVAEQAYYLMEWKDAVATLRTVARREGVPERNPRCFDQRAGWIHYGTNLGAEACWSAGGKGNYRLVTMATSCKQLNVDGTRLRQPAIYLAMEGVDDRMEPVRAAGLAYTDAGYLLMNFEAGGYIPARNQPDSPGCKARLARNPGL